jgi:hypothetical protein
VTKEGIMKIARIAVALSMVAAAACSQSNETPPPRSAQAAPVPEHPVQGPAGATPPSSWSSPMSPSIGGGPRPSPSESVSSGDADQAISDKVRASLQLDQDLSPSGKNVDIVTTEGKVILRGTVRSRTEKREVENRARQIAGEGEVESHLQVKK